MNTQKINTRQARIDKIKKKLMEIDGIMPGSLSRQYNICGNPHCKCKDPDNPQRHGPYYNLSYTRNGKGTTQFVRKDRVAQVKEQIKNYTKLKHLIKKWVDLSLEIAQLQKEH